MTISQETVRRRVKVAVATHKNGFEWNDIFGVYEIGGRWSGAPRGLGFNAQGRRVLLIEINGKFTDVGVRLTLAEMTKAVQVWDLWRALWKKIERI